MDNRYPINGANALQGQQPRRLFTKPIDGTTYEVFVCFSTKSGESMDDKILRLIQTDTNLK